MKLKSFLGVIAFFIVSLLSLGSFAQQNTTSEQDNKIYNEVDSYAYYAQGKEALVNFVVNATNYPKSETVTGKQFVVMTRFIVEKDGTISNVEVETGVNETFNTEAIRVVNSIKGAWVPAQKNGVAVRSIQYIPVGFFAPKK